jgi:hypothetical protein
MKGKTVHCGPNPAKFEGAVPIILFGLRNNDFFKEAAVKNRNKASRFNIPATLLLFMGYKENEIEMNYGKNLFNKGSVRKIFGSSPGEPL